METREILTRFKNGELSMEEAEHYFRKEPFEEMDDYAKLDSHREIRSGFPEVIFCSGKADQHFVHIFKKLYEDNGEVFGTRASRHQYELVKDLLPGVEYDELSHIIKIEKKEKEHIAGQPCVRVGDYHGVCLKTHADGRFMVPEDLWTKWAALGVLPTGALA